MMEISRVYTFAAAHALCRLPEAHKCSRMHGHNYSVEVVLRGGLELTLGWVCDFARIDAAWDALIRPHVDHRCLNDIEALQGQPTSELLAMWIFERLETHLGELLYEVSVSETAHSRVRYRRS